MVAVQIWVYESLGIWEYVFVLGRYVALALCVA